MGVGHGLYGVSSGKYTFSDWDSGINCKPIGFAVKVGETVEMEYDQEKSKLVFRKGKEEFGMEVQGGK